MTDSSRDSLESLLDFEVVSPEAITLSPEQIHQATLLSNQLPNESRRWQTYLNALALFAFEVWIGQRANDLVVKREPSWQPAINNVIPAVCSLNVNQFKLCLIAQGSFAAEEVAIPRAVVELPEYIPHFYVVLEVREEQEIAVLSSFISYEQLTAQRERVNLLPDLDWTLPVPFQWFDTEVERLLLYLRCLEPQAMLLPAAPNRSINLSTMQTELATLLPQLQSKPIWQVLTWEQGEIVLTTPELVNWLYQFQRQETPEANQKSSRYLSDLLALLTQPAIDVGRWLRDELDELAQDLSWVLLPTLAPAAWRRSPANGWEDMLRELQQRGVEIPLSARGAYRDLQGAGVSLRLYAFTWSVLEASSAEWKLLLVLGTPSQTPLPTGVRLRVSDRAGILTEQECREGDNSSYFFLRIAEELDESLIATISFRSEIELRFPPFRFTLNE
ncbi:MAG: DUF1822 family protein [Actinomycetota bacterium]